MRNYFSKLGTQVPWRTSQSRGATLALPLRYLSALFLLLTFSIGQSWAADEVVVIGSQSSGALTIATNTHSVAGISGGTNTGTITDASDGQSVSGGSKMGGTSEIGSKLVTKSKQHIRFTVVAGETVRFYYYQTGGTNKSSTFATSDFSQSAAYYHAATAYNAAAKNTLYFVDFVFADAGTYAISLTTGQSVYMAALKFTAPAAAHTVTYKAGDGSGSDVVDSDAKTVKAFADCSFTAPSGYEFKEWQDGSSNVVAAGATVSADMTLTAIYRLIPTKYTVTYNLNGASGDAPTETSKAEGDAFNLAAAPSWAGHAFDGWLCSADEAVKAAGSSYTMTAANTTFTAQWHEVDCKIYSLTGGIGSAAAEADAGNVVIDASSLVLKSSNAIIKLTPGSGTFKAGDILTISGTVGNTSKNFGVKISASNNKGSGLGLASAAGTSNPMVATATLSADADYLYICRDGGTTQTILTCEVHRSCAEGTAAGLSYAAAEVNKTEGDAAFTNPLTNANSLVLDGYKSSNEEVATVNFSTGEVTIVSAGSATITANSAIQTKAGTLYAAGTASYTLTVAALPKYHVTYDLNGGSGEVAEVDHKAGEKFTLHDGVTGVTAPESKTFVNWKDQDDALFDGGAEYTMPAKDVTLTAQWAGDVYTVKFMDGETVLDTKVVEVGSHPTDIEHPTKPLSSFAAWQLSGSDVNLDEVSGTKDAIVTLTARWTKVYAQDADLEGLVESEGTGADWQAYMSGKGYAYSTSGVSLDAKAGGKDYNNWPYQGLKAKEIGAYVEGRIAADKLVIIKLGHMAAAANVSLDGVAAGTATGLDADEPAGQLNYFYVENESVLRYETTNGGACVLKAITITNPFQVTFNANGGDPVAPQYGHPAVTLPDASNGTKSLLGWFDAAEGGNKIGDVGESYTPAADIELFAQWEDVSTDARLASIEFSAVGTLSPAFDPEVTSYTYTMPYGTADVPTITGATKANPAAKDPVIDAQAAAWGETAHVHGVAASDDTKDYYVQMLRAPKDGVSIIKAIATATGNLDITDENLTGLYKGAAHSYTSGSYKFDTKRYFMVQLEDGKNFQAGDIVEINVSTVNDATGFAIFSDIVDGDFASATLIIDTHVNSDDASKVSTGINKVTLPGSYAGSNKLYVARASIGEQSDKHLNAGINQVEVKRPMDPVMTAIKFNDTDVEVASTTVTATLPNGTKLGSMTVDPTIWWNGEGTAVAANAWEWDVPNTYTVTDKDGDATVYTITLTEDVLKHTVSFNTHGGTAIDPVQVVDGQQLEAAPADPEKEDYTFQGWAETDGGSIVDVTSFTIKADKEFHAVWAEETGVVKLLDGDGNVNVTDFITAVAKGTVNFDDVDHNCATFSSTASTIVGATGANKFIIYNAKTNQTKIKFVLYNSNSSAQKIVLQKLAEGEAATTDVEIDVPSKERFETPYYTYNSDANRTMYVFTKNTNVKVLQVKVVDDGTPVKQAGEIGYSLNLNKGRVFAPSGSAVEFDGLTLNASSNYKVLNSEMFQSTANISFSVASPVTLTLESTGAKYQVSTDAAGSGDEFVAGTNEHDLTAGTWYIVSPTGSNIKFTNIAFSAPKCEKPTIATIDDEDLCEGDAFTALVASASVSDGGTLHYAWFKEAGATDEAVGTDAASFAPEADGEYYVIVTNQKDGFADNTETSNVVTVQHLAGTTITTAPVSVRKDAGEAATLTVVAAGKNLAYEWFTCNADGTGAVAVDPAATEASLDVIVPDGEQYYKVVVTGDCGTVEAIAKVEKWVELTQQDVTETTLWDFSKTGVTEDVTIPVTEENPVKLLANIPTVNNNELFRSDNIVAGDGKLTTGYIQTQKLSFHATVPGYITVTFSNTGNKSEYRYLVVNGVQTAVGSKDKTAISYSCAVQKGDVELTVTEGNGGKMFNFRSLKFEKMDYFREIRPGYYGTICLEHGGKMYGAALYEVAYFDGADKIFFDEIIDGTMEPGMPYIFQSEGGSTALAVAYSEEAPAADALSKNGLYGSYTQEELTPNDGNYVLLNNQYLFVNSDNVYVGENRAYIRLNEISTKATPLAPGRRRIAMGVQNSQVATGMENLNAGEAPMKVMINGQLFILRGENMFDATGRLVK